MSELVSIVMPAFRPGDLFRDTLRSCLEQDWTELEIVITLEEEDAEVQAIVDQAADPRVRLLRNPGRLGQFANFNRALDASRGEFLKLLCADDLLARDAVRHMVEALRANPQIGFCAASHIVFFSGSDGRIEPRVEVPVSRGANIVAMAPAIARRYLASFGNQVGGPSNVMLRRSAWWQSGGFDPRISHLGDLAYWNRLAGCVGLVLLMRPLVGYRVHQNSVTGRDALSFVRVDDPFSIAEDSTVGAWFPNRLWRERIVRRIGAVSATFGYALSMLRRRPARGVEAVWRVISCGGPLLLPLTIPVAAWATLRSSILRLPPLWPRQPPCAFREVTVGATSATELIDLLSDESAVTRLREETSR